jgi:hypothetical protein
MKRVLVSLLIAAGVVYAISTLFLPNTGRPINDEHERIGDVGSTASAPRHRDEEQLADHLTPPVDADSPHAIVVETEPELTTKVETEFSEPSESPTIELAKVNTKASIQQGPSAATPIIGIAHPGAEAQIIARESEWVQIIDPASKKTGWVHFKFLEPQTETRSTPPVEAALDPADEAAVPPSGRSKASVRSGKHEWKRKRHKRGLALRFRLRRLF